MLLIPPLTAPEKLDSTLRSQGYAVLGADSVRQLANCGANELQALRPSWHDLPPDAYLKDGGHYRRRRHSCFVVNGNEVTLSPHRAHWQPLEYNALHGGMQRWFEPIEAHVVQSPAWLGLLRSV